MAVAGLIQNQGTFTVETDGVIDLGGAYLSGVELERIRSSQGAVFVSTADEVNAVGVTANTSLTLDGTSGVSVDGTVVNGALTLRTDGVARFDGATTTAQSLSLEADSILSVLAGGLS